MTFSSLRGMTYNVEMARPEGIVFQEIEQLAWNQALDFMCLQETTNYWRSLRRLPGYDLFRTSEFRGGSEAVILVKSVLNPTNSLFRELGDGWITVRGGHAPGRVTSRVSIGWLRLANVHLPPALSVDQTGVHGPPERVDDYLAGLRQTARFLEHDGARIMMGDWNVPANANARLTPRKVALERGAFVASPGEHSIDYALVKGCRITNVRRLHLKQLGSDHDPVLFTVSRWPA